MRPWLISIACLTVLVIGGIAAYRTAPREASGPKKIAETGAIEATWSRYWARKNEDGTPPPADGLMKALKHRERMVQANLRYAGVNPSSWTWLGPGNIGGRTRAIAIKPEDPNTMWTGATSGGIWKTTDGGLSWVPMDDFMPTLAVSTLVCVPGNSNTLLAGTGEGFFETVYGSSNKSAIQGAGIFRSTDGGASWNQIPSTASANWTSVNRLTFQPGNPNVVLAATGTGIYRSTDGGDTWTQVNAAQTYDVDFDPSNGSNAVAGLRSSGVLYSTDGGQTWTAATGISGTRTETAYAASNPSIVFAVVSTPGSLNNDSLNVYRSSDGGHSFAVRAAATVTTYSAYNMALWVNPTDANNIIYGGVNLYRSTDGGASRAQAMSGVHSDMHIIIPSPAFDGVSNRTVFVGCDGGIYKAADSNLNTVTNLNRNLGITQFYGAVMNPISGVVLGGTQDNGTNRYTGNIQGWSSSFGGDGGYAATDSTNSNYFYGETQHGLVFRSTNGGASGSYIYNGITDANSDLTNFATYFLLDPNNVNRMLVGCRRLWRSNNVKTGAPPTWSIIKDALGGNAPEGGGGIIPQDHFAEDNPLNISTVAIAPSNSDVIYIGYNNGQIWRTTNGTAATPSWTRIDDNAGPQPLRWVSGFAIDPTNPDHVYVAFQGWSADNVWTSSNGGSTWSQITGSGLTALPSAPASAIAVHPSKPGWLYVGTDIGLFTSNDDGQNWTPVNQGPAAVCVQELHFMSATSLFVATYGRGVYLGTVDLAQETVTPYAFSLFRGIKESGQLSYLWQSDDKRVVLKPGMVLTTTEAPIQAIVDGVSPYAAATQLSFQLECSVSTPGLNVSIDLWDYQASSYVQIYTGTPTAFDSVVNAPAPANPSRFIEPSTRRMRARVAFRQVGPITSYPWRANLDQTVWKVTP